MKEHEQCLKISDKETFTYKEYNTDNLGLGDLLTFEYTSKIKN